MNDKNQKNGFDYELVYKHNEGYRIEVKSGCPDCGNEVVFNGDIEQYVQFVSYDKNEQNNHSCGIDDGSAEITYLSCGKCEKVLVE